MCAAVPAVLLLPPIPRRAARIIVVSVLTLAILHGISNLYGLSFQAGRMDWVLTYFPQGYQELIYLVLWLLIDNMRAAIAAKHSE